MFEKPTLDLQVGSVQGLLSLRPRPGKRRQIGDTDRFGRRSADRELDDELELGHVAGPFVVDQGVHRRLVDSNGFARENSAGPVDREQREGRDVFAPIPKRGNFETWTGKTPRQVRIEDAASLKLAQRRARGRDDSRSEHGRLRDFVPGLVVLEQERGEAGLRPLAESRNVSEQQCPSGCGLKPSRAVLAFGSE
jgi:hypothetical protein